MESNLILPNKEIIRPGIEVPSVIKVTGHVKATLFKNGDFKKPIVVFDDKNTIQTACLEYLAGAIEKTVTDAIDNLFTGVTNPPTDAYDGIAVTIGTDAYSLKCTGTAANTDYTLGWTGSGASRKLTGELTGVTGTILSASDVGMGQNWQTSTFSNIWAIPGSWTSLTIDSASDYLYIEWTITLS